VDQFTATISLMNYPAMQYAIAKSKKTYPDNGVHLFQLVYARSFDTNKLSQCYRSCLQVNIDNFIRSARTKNITNKHLINLFYLMFSYANIKNNVRSITSRHNKLTTFPISFEFFLLRLFICRAAPKPLRQILYM
jgi:hypothetical protein